MFRMGAFCVGRKPDARRICADPRNDPVSISFWSADWCRREAMMCDFILYPWPVRGGLPHRTAEEIALEAIVNGYAIVYQPAGTIQALLDELVKRGVLVIKRTEHGREYLTTARPANFVRQIGRA
jgi:hypothetical protein